ncbi:MAG: thermopsin family protease [Thermoplasmata archaeon]
MSTGTRSHHSKLQSGRPLGRSVVVVAIAFAMIVLPAGGLASFESSSSQPGHVIASPVVTPTSRIMQPWPNPPVHIHRLGPVVPESVNPNRFYSAEPAPMGIADFGIGRGGAPYTYSTSEFLGNFTWQKLTLSGSEGASFTDQLNVVLRFVQGGTTYAYWIQDVAFMDSSNGDLSFEDNIWNFSNANECLSPTDLSGNGTVTPYSGCIGYYAVSSTTQPGASRAMPSPGNFQLLVRSYLSTGGLPEVAFEYRDGVTSWYVTYDNVVWPWAAHPSADDNFLVDGSQYNPIGLFYDAELGIGGPGGGSATVAEDETHAGSQLLYWNGHNFQAPLAAWNFGSNTAEAVSNIQSIWSAATGGIPQTIQLNGTTRNASPDRAYDQSQVGSLNVSAPAIAAGTVAVGNVDWNFIGDEANLTLDPGSYPVWVNSSGGSVALGECTILAGSTLHADTTTGCGPSTTMPKATPGSADVAQSVTFRSTVESAGSGGDTFTWNVAPGGLGCASSTTTTLTCTPVDPGTYRINLTIEDSLGNISTSDTLSFAVSSDPSTAIPSPSPPTVETGGSVTFSESVTGGDSPYAYVWSGLPTPCTGISGPSPTCTPSVSTTYMVSVTVTDANDYRSVSGGLSYTVRAGPYPSVPASSPSGGVDVGELVNFSTIVTSGSGTYSYRWHGLPTGCVSADQSGVSCRPSQSGRFNVSVTVTDTGLGNTTSGSLSYSVDPDPAVTLVAPPRTVDAGQSALFRAVASGGSGVYQYLWSGLPLGCSSSGSATDSCVPSAGGDFSVTVTVTDSNGGSATSNVLGYHVYGDPTVTTLNASESAADLGQSVNFTTAASGGSGGYTYAWSGLPFGCVSANTSSISCLVTSPGNYSVQVNVTDTNGVTATSHGLSFRVWVDPSVSSFVATPSGLLEGSGVTLSVAISGGSGPFTYSYSGLPSGCANVDRSTLSCTPTETGTFTVNVTVTDSNGWSTTATAVVTVNPELFGLPPSEAYLIVGVLVAAIAVGLLVTFMLRRRKVAGRPG